MAEEIDTMNTVKDKKSNGHSMLPAVIYCLALLILFHETLFSIIEIWDRSQTYMHGYIIAPISLWLIWSRRKFIAALPVRPILSVQVLILGAGMVWFLAHLIDVNVVQQLALVALLIVGVWSLVGNAIARCIAFALGFLFFAVPVGDVLVPYMMEFTATSTVTLIKWTGIPIYREGMFFTLPSGNWSVVYACSGIRYLIASVTLGVLYAYLTYRSTLKRVLFTLLSVVVPVLANSVRAYIIVMLGHLSDMKIATGVDHLLYGWVFFGIVMFLLFSLGSIWREDEAEIPGELQLDETASLGQKAAISPWLALVTALVAAGIWPAFSALLDSSPRAEVEQLLVAPEPVSDWRTLEESRWDWRPVSRGPDREMSQFYEQQEDVVALTLFQHFQQERGAELISGLDLFVPPTETWRTASRGKERINLNGHSVTVDRFNLIRGRDTLLVWSWYRVGEHYTAHRYEAKFWELIEKISFSDKGSVHFVIATNTADEKKARTLLQRFITAHLAASEAALDKRSMGQEQ